MTETLEGDADQHAKCRFPARLIWLRKNFPEYAEALAQIECPAFQSWISGQDVDSISIVFANGYLGNPASYYGHLFLKFNGSAGSRLLDQTANYGAIDTTGDDPLSYILKGITGGYDAGFSSADFFFHDGMYGESELRDLWEYRLDLLPDERDLVVAHTWEVLHKHHVYYFFHDNCAYRVGEMLELVADSKINPRNRPWIVPQSVLQRITQSSHHGQALVKARIFHPSRQTRLYQRFAELDGNQRELLLRIVANESDIGGKEMQARPTVDQQKIIDAVMDYQQFRSADKRNDPEKRPTPEYLDALKARLNLPPGLIEANPLAPRPPDTANSPSWLQFGFSQRDGTGANYFLRLRPAYYDGLDVSGAQAKNNGLAMGDIVLQAEKDRLHLIRLSLVSIDSMNPAVTNLPGDRGAGWRLKIGGEEDRIGCKHCFVGRIQADYAIGTWLGTPSHFAAVYAGGALQERSAANGLGFSRAGAAITSRPTPEFGLRANHEFRRPIDLNMPGYFSTSIEARYAFAPGYDVRAIWEKDQQARLSVGFGIYW